MFIPPTSLFNICPLSLLSACLQDNVLNIINQIMDECIPNDRANRDFSVKFPEEIRHDNLAGQLWFGAEVVYSNQHQSERKQPCTSPTHVHKNTVNCCC